MFTEDGRRRIILLNVTARRDASGQVVGVIGVWQGVVELRQAERELAVATDGLQQLIRTANAPILGVDTHGKVREWNPRLTILSDYPREETEGRDLGEFVDPECQPRVVDTLHRAMTGKEENDLELPVVSRGWPTS